ncbi:MAG TPA: sensor histidine kinase [Candidatus Eisenbergiella merdavium]|uniref:histidine kinase n=1 Tax=Candidatus Eisenbergiella merdavium TaxID=2838551 RepID=A0A9D2NET4_9FIRM|nr:sensor histidine kinase [Candidatus Eisenbergiella merdavium]
MLKKISRRLLSIGFRQRIAFLLIMFTLVPSAVIQQAVQYIYEDQIIRNASEAVYSVVAANDNTISTILEQVEDTSQLMLNDESYYNAFADIVDGTVSDFMKCDREITLKLAREFTTQNYVFETYLYTQDWLYGESGTMSASLDGLSGSGLIQMAEEKNGKVCWTAGYDFGEAIASSYLLQKEFYEYQYPITMLRKMDFQYNNQSEYKRLSSMGACPILFVYLLEEDLRGLYENSVEYEGSLYGIADENGRVVSSDNDSFTIGSYLPEVIRKYAGREGYENCALDGREYLICFHTLESPAWFSYCLVPMDTLLKDTIQKTRQSQLLLLGIFMLLSVAAAILFSKTITRPVRNLMEASRRAATGDFRADTPVPMEREFRMLTESFNHMEKEISSLIHENYEIRLQEKETRLKMLSIQINPHFLYNTLNTINMLAIRNGDTETSDLIVSLSEMLQYSLKNSEDKIRLEEEMEWLSNYLYIMTRRYENVFRTEMDIDEELMECMVPKFFLQPLVENAIRHGFKGVRSGGLLRIAACREGESIHFQVQDNGRGMDQETARRLIAQEEYPEGSDDGIGLSNVFRRLVLSYGERCRICVDSAPGKGTLLHLYLPCEL